MSIKMAKTPPDRTVLSALDNGARESLVKAKTALSPVVTAQTPKGQTGAVQAAMKPTVSRTGTGQVLTVGPSRGKRHPGGSTVAQVVKWVTTGTGLKRKGGGRKARIHSPRLFPYGARMTLPGGAKRFYVKGQKANPFVQRIMHTGDRVVQRELAHGAQATSNKAAALIGD